MKEMTTEELLKEIEEKHNNSLFEEIFKRRDKELYRTALFYKGTKINYLTLDNEIVDHKIKSLNMINIYNLKHKNEIENIDDKEIQNDKNQISMCLLRIFRPRGSGLQGRRCRAGQGACRQ